MRGVGGVKTSLPSPNLSHTPTKLQKKDEEPDDSMGLNLNMSKTKEMSSGTYEK
jgi:hypothetical protein